MNCIAVSALGSSMDFFSLYRNKVSFLVARFYLFKWDPSILLTKALNVLT